MTLSKGTSSMLGRGVKRKRSCLEELEVEVLPDAAGKAEEEDGGDEASDMSHMQQRQLVLSLCLEKLQHYKAGVELSLRRSVLLVNTLRQIQEEMRSDGTGSDAPDLRLHGINPDSRLLRDDFREDMPVTCPGCAAGDGDSPSPPLPPFFPSQNANGSTSQQKSLPTITNTFSDAANAMGYLRDLPLDDIFEDIDTSMYETSDLPAAWGSGSLWPVSVSLWPDEDMKSHSLSHSTGGGLQSCLMDLNELDHIMEVLVKS